MSPIKAFLRAGMRALESAWGTDDIIVGSHPCRAIWNDSLDSRTLQEGGFSAADIASVLIRTEELPAGVALGWRVTARGKTWRVHEIRGRSDVAATLTLVAQHSTR